MKPKFAVRFLDTRGFPCHRDCVLYESQIPVFTFSSHEEAVRSLEDDWVLQREAAGRPVEVVTIYTVPEEVEG